MEMRFLKKHIIWLLGLIIILINVSKIEAQNVSASLDTTEYLIGDYITLDLKAIVEEDQVVDFPLIDMTIGELEVLKRTDVDSTIANSEKTYRQQLTLMVFDSGYYPIPAFDFSIGKDTFSTEPKIVKVSSVEIDTASTEIKDIKTIIEVKRNYDFLWKIALAILVLILIATLVYWFIIKRRKEPIVEKAPEIIIPAHEWANKALQELKADSLIEKGEIKSYYSRLTNILRQYIELRYKQPALESTTDEIMLRLNLLKLNKPLLERTQMVLTLSDYVKFAKAKPLADEHISSFETVEQFIEETKLVIKKMDEL